MPSNSKLKPSPPDDIVYPDALPFAAVHVACIAVLWTGFTWTDWIVCFALYVLRMWGITAGYHRYFSHRSFKTSRVFQFLLAFLAQSSAQQGVLWWSAIHRHHHRHSDTPEDVHSPRHHGFLFSHFGWIFSKSRGVADYAMVKDLSRYPELVWLDRWKYFPPFVLALTVLLLFGWSGLIVGFFISTVILFHGTFSINSLAHTSGSQRYITGDDSRNNFWLALITLGEGWHNNHHYYQSSTRQGFRWWEIDVTFYVLKCLSWVRIVRDLRSPPSHVVMGERPLSGALVEKVARQLAASFSVEGISRQIQEARSQTPDIEVLMARMREARLHAVDTLQKLQLPQMPSPEELRRRAQEMFASTPSIDDIVNRAHRLISEAVCDRLMIHAPAQA